MWGFSSFKIGITLWRTLFLTYFTLALDLSSLQTISFFIANKVMSSLEKANNGLTDFLLIAGIPVNPSKPLPLVKFIMKVSKLSLVLCAVNT